jgi:transcriptional regulator with XRE-family HTH domain
VDFTQKLSELMSKNNITAYKINKDVGISKTLVSDYQKGFKKPTIDNLVKVADYFNVSVDYLLGRDEIKKSSTEQVEDDDILEIVAKLKKLTSKARQRVNDNIDDMLANPANLIAAQEVKKRA